MEQVYSLRAELVEGKVKSIIAYALAEMWNLPEFKIESKISWCYCADHSTNTARVDKEAVNFPPDHPSNPWPHS